MAYLVAAHGAGFPPKGLDEVRNEPYRWVSGANYEVADTWADAVAAWWRLADRIAAQEADEFQGVVDDGDFDPDDPEETYIGLDVLLASLRRDGDGPNPDRETPHGGWSYRFEMIDYSWGEISIQRV